MTPAVDTYVDGELDPSQVVEVEAHLAQCGQCREQVALTRAMRSSMKRVVAAQAPSSLRDRIKAQMAAEKARSGQAAQTSPASAPAKAPESQGAQVLQLPSRPSLGSKPEVAVEAPKAPAKAVEAAKAEAAEAETRSGPASQRRWTRPSGPLRNRYALPFAVAAGVAFAISMRKAPSQLEGTKAVAVGASEASAMSHAPVTGLDGILDDLVSLHAQPLPPEVTLQDDVRTFDPFVGVPVEPPKLQPFGAKWVGGRMLPIRDSRAAALQYSLAGGHRVTVYVYDPRRVKQESRQLQSKIVRNAPVFVGNVRGYNIAATERRGVGYALATDLDERESLELVAASAP